MEARHAGQESKGNQFIREVLLAFGAGMIPKWRGIVSEIQSTRSVNT